ncbi:ParB-like partition protein [Pseudomonas phage Psp6]|nr:ParB-like partition protein [Pseudomonas phage Psp6]
MASFRQMTDEGTIKRADAYKVRLEDLHIEPGFNLRDPLELDENGMTFEESIHHLAKLILKGLTVPPLEVRPRDEGGVYIVEGERRTRAWRLLDERGELPRVLDKKTGKKEFWVQVSNFEGNDADRTLRIMTSNQRRELRPIEIGRGYLRLKKFGWPIDQIAEAVGKGVPHVKDMIELACANVDVQQMVRENVVKPTTAIKTVREHGEKAGAVLAKAAAENGGKVKPRHLATPKPKAVPVALFERLELAAKDLVGLYEGTPAHEAIDGVRNALAAIEKVRDANV